MGRHQSAWAKWALLKVKLKQMAKECLTCTNVETMKFRLRWKILVKAQMKLPNCSSEHGFKGKMTNKKRVGKEHYLSCLTTNRDLILRFIALLLVAVGGGICWFDKWRFWKQVLLQKLRKIMSRSHNLTKQFQKRTAQRWKCLRHTWRHILDLGSVDENEYLHKKKEILLLIIKCVIK